MRQLARKWRNSFSSKGITAACAALLFFFAWHPAQAGQASSPGKVMHLDVGGLELLLRSDPNVLLIDVRTPEELVGPLGKIPQSRSVPMREVKKNPEQFPRDKTLVLICLSGYRSSKAAGLLAEHGYVVYSVDGGMQAWREVHPRTPAEETSQPRDLGAPVPKPEAEKTGPPENKNAPLQDKDFLDNGMGC